MTAAWQSLTLYLSPPHDCSYLENRIASNAVVDPAAKLSPALYGHLLGKGFRRSGDLVYRPHCGECQACVATRIPVADFKPNRSQRRIWRQNKDLDAKFTAPALSDEYFELYQRYLSTRHAHGGMDNPSPESFKDFLLSSWGETRFIEFRDEEKLVAVAVVDVVSDAYSAMYTFFDPALPKRSLGNYAILWMVESAARKKLDWVYLGYWIESCRKMQYKTQFQLLEGYMGESWQLLPNIKATNHSTP